MKKVQVKICPNCNGTFKSLNSHLLRSKKCAVSTNDNTPHRKRYISKSRSRATKFQFAPNDYVVFSGENKVYIPNNEKTAVAMCSFIKNQDTITLTETSKFDKLTNQPEIQPCLNDDDSINMRPTYVSDSMYCDNLFFQKKSLLKNKNAIIDEQIVFLCQLVKLLNDTNSPLNMYDKIMNWAIHSVKNGFQFSQTFPSRKKVISEMSKVCCLNGSVPIQKSLSLTNNEETSVNYFDFEQQCFSMLTNPDLMSDKNMSFPNTNPCDYVRKNINDINCIEDGQLFQDTAASVCKNPNDFCLGIKLFIDATHTDVHSNWLLDPVMFTFTFFTNELTKSDKAWRTLGLITDTDQNSRAQNKQISTRDKLQDFHLQLKLILESVKKCQDKGGFMWDLEYKKTIHRVRMIPVIILIIGDAKGNHQLAGMYGKFCDVARVNHSCDCPWLDSDNPNVSCQFMKHSHINQMSVEGNEDELQALSHHNISNAFDTVSLGNHIAGLNAIMPAEILHQLFLGIFNYILEEFFNEFSPMAQSRMDEFGKLLYIHGKHNSDRSIPSFNSRNGFTSLTKQAGSDRVGTCLLCLLILSMDFNDKELLHRCVKGPSEKRRVRFRILFEELLIYAEWLCSERFDRTSLPKYHNKIRSLMINFKNLVTRPSSSAGLKLSKFHEMLHVCRDISLFGPPEGYDGRPGESAHKKTKVNARKTQRRHDMFEKQTCERIYECLVTDTFYEQRIIFQNPQYNSIRPDLEYINEINGMKSHYYIFKDDNSTYCSSSIEKHWKQSVIDLHLEVVKFVVESLDTLSLNRIQCKNVVRIHIDNSVDHFDDLQNDELEFSNVSLFRSNPSMNKEEWYDWAWFRWIEGGLEKDVPARIYCFIDLRHTDISDEELQQKGFSKTIYACIRSLMDQPTLLTNGGKILTRSKFEDIPERYRLIDVNSIVGSCYVIPNFVSLEDDEFADWIIIQNRYKWGDHFTNV